MTRTHVMPFGKYKGRQLQDLPTTYLDWLLSLPDLRQPLAQWLLEEARARGLGTPELRQPVDYDMASELVEAGRRQLARKYHPDVGGSSAKMTLVNATADRLLEAFSFTGDGEE